MAFFVCGVHPPPLLHPSASTAPTSPDAISALSGSCHDSPHHTTNSTVCSLEFQDLIPASSTQLTEVLDLSYNSNCTYLYTACLKPNPSSESFPRSRTSSFQSYPQFPRRPSSKVHSTIPTQPIQSTHRHHAAKRHRLFLGSISSQAIL